MGVPHGSPGRVFEPLVALVERLLDDGAFAGVVRPGLRHRSIAGVVLQALSFPTSASTISGSTASHGDALWELLVCGIARPDRRR